VTSNPTSRIVQARGRRTGRSVHLELSLGLDPGIELGHLEAELLGRISQRHEEVRDLAIRISTIDPIP
jgi:hypothetical protein